MDRFIAGFAGREDCDLMLCRADGVAYQRDMSRSVAYNGAYFDKYVGYEGALIAQKINAGRVALVNRHIGAAGRLVDIGIGSGEFIKARGWPTTGHDVNAKALHWLDEQGLRANPELFWTYQGFSFWDVLEHVPEPEDYFRRIRAGAFLFTSIPVFERLDRIRQSKHYRPDEHYYYFTASGFVAWMALHGFSLIERSDFETCAGREAIKSFAFRRTRG